MGEYSTMGTHETFEMKLIFSFLTFGFARLSRHPRSDRNCDQDLHEHCDYWASQGHCQSEEYGEYMDKNCPVRCETCAYLEQEAQDCRDFWGPEICKADFDAGRCDEGQGVIDGITYDVMEYCKRTCLLCDL